MGPCICDICTSYHLNPLNAEVNNQSLPPVAITVYYTVYYTIYFILAMYSPPGYMGGSMLRQTTGSL